MSDAQPPAGWYPDPQDAQQQRYWDGNAWTGHTAPTGGAPSAPTGDAPSVGVPVPTGAPSWQMPMGAAPMGGPVGKKPFFKRRWVIVTGVVVVVLIVLGAIFGTQGDHSNGLEKAIKTDGQKQFQANLSEADPGATVKVTDVSCVETGDTQEYNCLIHLAVTESDGTSQNYIANAEGSCDKDANCLWHTTDEPHPTAS